MKDIYFEPKKMEQEKIEEIIDSVEYQKVLLDTITHLHNINLDIVFEACNFSEEVVPNKQKSYYTIVPNTTVEWVENNLEVIDKVVEPELNKNNMMYDFFYMFAKTKIPNMPVRTGYVYGYIKVKEYMRKNNFKIKDIVKSDWREVLNG